MTPEFAAHMQARLEELVAGEKFPRKRDGEMVEPQVYRTQLPGRDRDYAEGDNAPHLCWAVTDGRVDEHLMEFTVVIVMSIWTPGDVRRGSADIERLLRAVLPIARELGFAGHRLSSPTEFHLGRRSEDDYEDGVQPHPLYEAQIKLRFSAPMRRTPCNR